MTKKAKCLQCGIDAVHIQDVVVSRDVDACLGEAEEGGGAETGPGTEGGVVGPGEPEYVDG